MPTVNETEMFETKIINVNERQTADDADFNIDDVDDDCGNDPTKSKTTASPNENDVMPATRRSLILDHNNLRESENAKSAPAATTLLATATNQATSLNQRPTTPTPARKITPKRSTNLSLKITRTPARSLSIAQEYAETDNSTLSSSSTSASTSATAIASTTSTTTSDTIFPHEQYRTLKKLDIGFQNIKYSVKTGFFKRGTKEILNGVTGYFKAGELNAILGPSGAGKSTFLNILSSYTPFGYTGDITVNGNLRDIKAFKPNSAFITQDTSLQPFLTVKEAMHFAANLKIGTHMTTNEKRERVRKILEAIGMYENRHTRTGNLSGGQKKRLAIALELVNNPPVLMLDEPTSGLDSSTSNQCITLLKKLAMEGRTVICTIHQPSALIFNMFDHMYAIAEGKCIYSGGSRNLVPFLAEIGLNCPESYNPADYLMEIATDDYGKQNHKLVEKIGNGRNNSYRQTKAAKLAQIEAMQQVDKMMASGLITPVTAPILSPPLNVTTNFNYASNKNQPEKHPLTPINEMSSRIWDSEGRGLEEGAFKHDQQDITPSSGCCSKPKKTKLQLDPPNLCKRENIYATPFYRQLGILLVRTFLIMWRDKSISTMRFVIHFVTAILIGCIYYGIGNDAGKAPDNLRYAFYTIMFIMYCAFSAILVKFPLEFPVVSREHFNRWYSLRAYYVAITLADIPIQVICTSLFILTTYLMTDQPLELLRLGLFSFIVFLTALVAQSIGLAVGASLSVQLGSILGPFFICPFLAFSGFFLRHVDAPGYFSWVFYGSFLKYSFDGAALALFGYDRPKMPCYDDYCHYSRPKILLKHYDLGGANYEMSVIFLLSAFLGLRILAFYIMSFRLRLFR